MRMFLLALLCMLVFPATAWAGKATIVSRDLPVGPVRTAAGAAAPSRFDLVGLHWQGPGRVLFRTRSLAGRWSDWHPAAPEAEDRPDPGSAEGRGSRRGWHLGSPYWVGASDRVDYRLEGDVRRLRAWFVWSPVERSTARTVSMAGSPQIVSRTSWKANEEIRGRRPGTPAPCTSPSSTIRRAPTRTAGPRRRRSCAAIELYHVRGNGWNDIGYNFLVDRYGQVFEGRAGGTDRNVIGAHAEGFNTGSVGVAVIGNYSATAITPAAEHALAMLLAWRLDVAHVDPLGLATWASGGNARFRRGVAVPLRAISGHRDTGFTSCPGDALEKRLPDLAHEVAAIGLPKLYAPAARGTLGGPVTFTARLSAARPWVVTVRSDAGRPVARGAGSSLAVSWTWNSLGVTPGRYTWTIEAGPDTRPAQGTIGRAPPPPSGPILSGLTLDPPVLSPDGDGVADATTITYTLAGRATVTAAVTDASGAIVATLFADQRQAARTQSFPYAADGLPDGSYVLTVSAVGDDGRTGSLETSFGVDRTLSALALSTQALTPNGDGSDDSLGIGFSLSVDADVTVQIEQAGVVIAPVFAGRLPAGPAQLTWDGSSPAGPAADGAYEVVVIVNGPFGVTRHVAAFSIVH